MHPRQIVAFLAVGIISLYIPFTFASGRPNWLDELREMGFEGDSVTILDPQWSKQDGFNPRGLLVTAIPDSPGRGQIWKHFDPEFIEVLRKVMATKRVGLVLTITDSRTPHASAAVTELERDDDTDTGEGDETDQLLVLTPLANLLTLKHEIRHLDDQFLNLPDTIDQKLRDLSFSEDHLAPLTTLIMETRAYMHEYNLDSPEKILRYTDRLKEYISRSKAVLANYSASQKQRFVILLESFLADIELNDVGLMVMKRLGGRGCEAFLETSYRSEH